MSANELKEKLIEKIQHTQNTNVLEGVYRLLEIENDESKIYNFSQKQETEVLAIRSEMQQGQAFSNDEADKETDEWLNK